MKILLNLFCVLSLIACGASAQTTGTLEVFGEQVILPPEDFNGLFCFRPVVSTA
jgi:hypothetical protein